MLNSILAHGLSAVAVGALSLLPRPAIPSDGTLQCHGVGGAQVCIPIATNPGGGGGSKGGGTAPVVPRPIHYEQGPQGPQHPSGPLSPADQVGASPLTPLADYLLRLGSPLCLALPGSPQCMPPINVPSRPSAPSAPAPGGAVPAAPAPPQFTPAQVQQMAMDKLVMNPPAIGSAPCTHAGCKGAVGVPAWFWVPKDSWAPKTASATAGPFTVTVTATPTSVTWDLGDGTSITCNGPGTPFDKSKGWGESPDCGSKYRKAGNYTLTATMNWNVTWSGAANGQQTMTTTSSSPVSIGEYQVVVTGH